MFERERYFKQMYRLLEVNANLRANRPYTLKDNILKLKF